MARANTPSSRRQRQRQGDLASGQLGHRVETLFQREEEPLVVGFPFPQELVQGHCPVVRLVVLDKITECFSFCSDPLGTPFYPGQPVYQSAPIIVPAQQQPPPAKREKKTVRDRH